MTDRVLQEVKRLQQDGPSADLTSKAKEAAKSYETALKQNAYWLGRLQRLHLLGSDPQDILTRPARIDALTPAVLQDTFKKYFPLDRYTVVTLVPEPVHDPDARRRRYTRTTIADAGAPVAPAMAAA